MNLINKINRFIYCIIDCVRSEHFFDFINKGLMPNFKKLMENGIFSKNCITDFPSVTYPCQVSMITGTYTGDYRRELCHGVPLSNWMERNIAPPFLRCYGANDLQIYKINKDLGTNCKTILEMIGEGNNTSIIQFINRGTDYFYPEHKIKLIFYYLLLKYSMNLKKTIININTRSIYQLLDNFKNPKMYFADKEPPIGSLLYLFSSDLLMHMFGYDSWIYKLNLLHFDKIIGFLMDELEKMGYLNDTAIVITSDHGNYKAKKVGNITSFLEHKGLTHYHPRKNLKGNINIAEFGGVGFFNFKSTNNTSNKYSWIHPTINELKKYGPKRINLLEELFKIEGSHLMYYKGDENTYNKGIIYLKRKDKKTGNVISGAIEYKGSGRDYKTKYVLESEDNDVFGFINDDVASKIIDNKFHSISEWLDVTQHLDYPMYPDLIPRHFKNPRSSDIILSTDGSVIYNIIHGKQENMNLHQHDIGLRNSSIVPLIIAGSPEIPNKEIPYCKTTDIVPTLLKMLGKKPDKSVIGKSLNYKTS